MKKAVLSVLSFILLAAVAVPAQAAPKKQEYPERTCGGKDSIYPFKIGGFADYAPFSWKEQDMDEFKRSGKVVYRYHGFVVDAVMQALKDTKIFKIEEVMFDTNEELRKAAAHGTIDILFTTFYEGEGTAGLDYIYPAYFGNPVTVISRRDKKVEKSDPAEFKGMKGVVRKEEGMLAMVQGQLPTDTKIVEVTGAESAFKLLLDGEVDFMISSPYAVQAEAERLGVKDKLYIYPKSLRPMKIFAAFSKLSKCRQFKEKFEESFSAQFSNKEEAEKRMHKYIKIWNESAQNSEEINNQNQEQSSEEPTAQ